jgi:hypothetical protein
MTPSKFFRLTAATIAVAGILVALFNLSGIPFFIVFFIIMNVYYVLDDKLFK